MGGACGAFGREETHTGFWCGDVRGKDHMKDLVVDGG
jgi:hypothetical protein